MATKKTRKKAAKKKASGHKPKPLPKKDKHAEKRFHVFLDLWNDHIQEQINIHERILAGKESLKQHIARTKLAHKKFLQKLSKI
ncbi:hypothetical protein HY572_00515 [Candidatus Micrarchaeota archaeon]|nr:hypothetical protein [Candidatus Micrarchaeota archaeon]